MEQSHNSCDMHTRAFTPSPCVPISRGARLLKLCSPHYAMSFIFIYSATPFPPLAYSLRPLPLSYYLNEKIMCFDHQFFPQSTYFLINVDGETYHTILKSFTCMSSLTHHLHQWVGYTRWETTFSASLWLQYLAWGKNIRWVHRIS